MNFSKKSIYIIEESLLKTGGGIVLVVYKRTVWARSKTVHMEKGKVYVYT